MGRYSEPDDARVKETIDNIKNELANCFHPRSIVLGGGFGRGEASFIRKDGQLMFLSDCELILVANKYISRRAIKNLSKSLSQKAGLELVIHHSLVLSIYSLLPIPRLVSNRIWKCSIKNYDLKYGSKVIFGNDVLGNIPDFEPQDIPLWEGIRLIFNRMAESLRFSPTDQQDPHESIYWINKVILACQDALLLSIKQYHHSYKARNLMFQELLPLHFSELVEKVPKFQPLASRATEYKLRPKQEAYLENPSELWFDTIEICDEVFRYIINRDTNITFGSYIEFQEKYLKHPNIRKDYYLGVTPAICQNAINTLKMKLNASYKRPPFKLVMDIRTPWQHIIYSVIPLVYFALSREGQIDDLQLKQARNTILLFKKLKPQNRNPLEEWKYIKERVFALWRTLCY